MPFNVLPNLVIVVCLGTLAAANIEVARTDVSAQTIHRLFELYGDQYDTTMETGKMTSRVADLVKTQVFLFDEVSMVDCDCWNTVKKLLSELDHTRRPDIASSDALGACHIILFGDFKQLPPATSQAPFIVDPAVLREFEFLALRLGS